MTTGDSVTPSDNPVNAPLELTDQQRANLLKLAEGLLTLPDLIESQGLHFSMKDFFKTEPRSPKRRIASTIEDYNCGTAACALGYGPYLGITPNPGEDSWFDYADEAFGTCTPGRMVTDAQSMLWNWLFSNRWTSLDNTPDGAARRIFWFLKNGLPATLRQPYDTVDAPKIEAYPGESYQYREPS